MGHQAIHRLPGPIVLRRVASLLVATVVAAGGGVGPATAQGSGGVTCPPDQPICIIVVEGPGSPAPTPTSPGAGDAPQCRLPISGEPIDCYDPSFGWWSNSQGCYFLRLEPQPDASDPIWNGHEPGGSIYQATCPVSGGIGGGWLWLPAPPDGYGGTASPATLAQRALDSMRLDGPAIGMAPDASGTGLVGLPVWMWTEVRASTWGPTSATASIPGLSVTATARASKVEWDMGDGHTVTCTSPGTAYTKAAGDAQSPTCGHVYRRSSAGQPGDAYPVTATTTWTVSWSGGGQSGVLTVTRTSRTSVRIGELQVLVT